MTVQLQGGTGKEGALASPSPMRGTAACPPAHPSPPEGPRLSSCCRGTEGSPPGGTPCKLGVRPPDLRQRCRSETTLSCKETHSPVQQMFA